MQKKILIIEDDRSAARLAQYTIQQAGYDAIIAYDGYDGLDKTLREHPDLVILDIMLPGLDGYEVCHRLRAEPETITLPILMISAKAREEDKNIGLKVGADDYLAKPVEPSVMLEKIEELLARKDSVVFNG
jgi:two-component system alkaline phosphatase synthesis response regulator PhoP